MSSNTENRPPEPEPEEEEPNTDAAAANSSETEGAEGDPPIIITGGGSGNPV